MLIICTLLVRLREFQKVSSFPLNPRSLYQYKLGISLCSTANSQMITGSESVTERFTRKYRVRKQHSFENIVGYMAFEGEVRKHRRKYGNK